ncbi:MAG: RluA family pseudouridine synthase [Chloroflexi bacterium]|nr:RluA family pseudouridine synthase [Chloroflexota bacterium]
MGDRVLRFIFQGLKGERLDKFLAACLPEYSRSRLQGLIRDGFVIVGFAAAEKAGQELKPGQVVEIRIPPPEPSALEPEDIPLEIIYEDRDLIAINKPAGMVVHPAAGHSRGTLVQGALAHAPEMEGIGGELRPGIVHRLDKDTSGVILVAKNDSTHRWLQDQFRLRKAKKTYLALVDGRPPTPTGRIEAAVGRDLMNRKKMAVVPEQKGRPAVSEYRTLEQYPAHTLLEVHPLTGRTHQIRLHMAWIGCPIVGDTVYGRKHPSLAIRRHFLHAARLEILLPRRTDPAIFEAPLPADLQAVLVNLGKQFPISSKSIVNKA